MEIPPQLRNFRFVLLPAHGKDPFEPDWQSSANYSFDDPKLVGHLEKGNNYGVLAGPDHIIVETDTAELDELIDRNLPPTFTVRSPGHKTRHFYFRGRLSKTYAIMDKTRKRDEWNIGHAKWGGSQVVGPNCRHPNGNEYKVVDDRPIADVTEEKVLEVLAPFLANLTVKAEREEAHDLRVESELNIRDLVAGLGLGLKQRGDELFGSHPTHGSSTGQNFHVNLSTGVWYCFHCCSGGGAISLLAVLEGIIDCSEAIPGGLRGRAYTKAYSAAIQRGLIKPPGETKTAPWKPEPADIPQLTEEMSFTQVAKILDSTVKRDAVTKKILFAANILTYTAEEQINLLMAAESSAGKSYLPIEISAYFPEGDVLILGGASPTSFFHEVSGGELAIWDPEKKQSIVKLANKILIFLDQPHSMLLEKLRPFLSHDQKKIKYKISDRSQKAGLRTKTIILEGFSTVEFCTVNFNLDQQERTRTWQLSPETDEEKIGAAQDLLLERKSDRDAFRGKLAADPDRQYLVKRVLDIKNAAIRDILIPVDLKGKIKQQWEAEHRRKQPRHVRDLDRFLSLVKARALLNWRNRRKAGEGRIEANADDYEEANTLYREISESNELGLAPQAFEIFRKVILPVGAVGASKRDILRSYFNVYGRPLPLKRLEREIIPPLDASGLIFEETDPDDRRSKRIYPQVDGNISGVAGKQNTPPGGGNGGSPPKAEVANGHLLVDITKLRQFILEQALPRLKQRFGYGTMPQLLYLSREKFGNGVDSDTVRSIVESLEHDGLVMQPRPGQYQGVT